MGGPDVVLKVSAFLADVLRVSPVDAPEVLRSGLVRRGCRGIVGGVCGLPRLGVDTSSCQGMRPPFAGVVFVRGATPLARRMSGGSWGRVHGNGLIRTLGVFRALLAFAFLSGIRLRILRGMARVRLIRGFTLSFDPPF